MTQLPMTGEDWLSDRDRKAQAAADAARAESGQTLDRVVLAQTEPGGVCARCGGWVCDPVVPQQAQPAQTPCDIAEDGVCEVIDCCGNPAQQALEALEAMNPYPASKAEQRATAIAALRAALAEPVQEPAFHGFISADGTQVDVCFTPSAPRADGAYATAYYTASLQRKQLSDEQWQTIADVLDCFITGGQQDAIEAVLGIGSKT